MNKPRLTPEFKEAAVRQIVVSGHSVVKVSARLGVSGHSLYKWAKAARPDRSEKEAADLIEANNDVQR